MKKQKNNEPIQTTISKENRSRLLKYCSQNDITPAALVRKLISRFLTNYENRIKKADPFDTSDLSGQSVMSENFEI